LIELNLTTKKAASSAAFFLPGGANLRVFGARGERANLSAQKLLRPEVIDNRSTDSHRIIFRTSRREDRLPRSRDSRSLATAESPDTARA
jgi:hypothetical protein